MCHEASRRSGGKDVNSWVIPSAFDTLYFGIRLCYSKSPWYNWRHINRDSWWRKRGWEPWSDFMLRTDPRSRCWMDAFWMFHCDWLNLKRVLPFSNLFFLKPCYNGSTPSAVANIRQLFFNTRKTTTLRSIDRSDIVDITSFITNADISWTSVTNTFSATKAS